MAAAPLEVGPLFKGSDAAAEKLWAGLADDDLDHEITAHRNSIQDLKAKLQGLGIAVSLDERGPEGEAARDLPVWATGAMHASIQDVCSKSHCYFSLRK